MVSLPRFGSLWAFGPSAHRAHASLRAFGHSKRLRAAGAGEARTHGASGGRGDAPTAAGAGACSGAFADWDKKHGPAGTAAGCGETRFLHPGCSIIRASLPVALMVSLPRFGSLWAFGPTAHRADASLRAARALATLARSGGGGGPHPWRERWARGRVYRGGSGRMQRSFCRAVRRSMARRGQLRGAGRRVSCAARALETLAPPAFAAKTAHAIASVGRVWDPPASERRPSPYRAQRGRPLMAAARANQLFSAKTVDKAKRWCYHSCKQRRRRQSRYESSTHGPQLRLLLYL